MAGKKSYTEEHFRHLSTRVSDALGSVRAFVVAVAFILATGLIFSFSEEWKENLDFAISISTLLFLFFLQKSQNVGDKATHLKLDEIIRALGGARNEVTFAEEKSEQEIDSLRETIMQDCENQQLQHSNQ